MESSTIIIPEETAQREAPEIGTVLAVGPEVEAVKEGDVVYFGQYAGAWIKIDGEDLFICLEEDIHGIAL